ncbi:hypothetical protein AB0M02_41825 [Actinoplanes sp. NPDC051861]|uniref:hypothetical protein n=1 Tax=Actinoplanes sp. NPDC051861 TaxID=3155170 RepID=UPI00344612E4
MRVAVAALALLVTGSVGAPALAAKRLTVSKTKGLDRTGETVTVSGSGYDETKGIYVAFCLDNGPGVLPSPCGGGADMSGSSGSSAWISSNPPSYAEGLAQPYRSGGSFRVSIRVSQMIGDIDCAVRGCAIVTRADHTRTADRSQDKRVPIRFAPAAATSTTAAAVNPVTPTGTKKPTKKPVGPPAGKLATAAPPEATTPVAALAAEPALSRTSSATPLGHWWAIGGAFMVGAMAASVVGRLRRQKQEKA